MRLYYREYNSMLHIIQFDDDTLAVHPFARLSELING